MPLSPSNPQETVTKQKEATGPMRPTRKKSGLAAALRNAASPYHGALLRHREQPAAKPPEPAQIQTSVAPDIEAVFAEMFAIAKKAQEEQEMQKMTTQVTTLSL